MRDGFIKIAAATPDLHAADCAYNTSEIVKLAKEAAAKGAKLITFPELCLTGYTCGDLFLQETLLEGALDALNTVCRETAELAAVIVVGLPLRVRGKLYNVAAVVNAGDVLAFVPKTHLPNYSEFYEQRHFVSADTLSSGMEGVDAVSYTHLLLGVINGVTADKITQNGIETRNAAMAEIIPDADFEDLDTALSAEDVAAAGVTLPAGRTAAQIDGVYKATKDGEEIGYCVQVEPKGFGGNLTMIVGINADGTVAGAKVTSHAETPGLGAKSQADPNWITQFAGQTADGQLKVAKDGGTINAITGATITSRAVTDGVNTAAAYVATLG